MRGETILITGASGLIGGAVLRNLLAKPGAVRRAWVLVRDPRAWRVSASARGFCPERVVAISGDITRPGLGLSQTVRSELADSVTMVIHCAADTSFSQTLPHARGVNTTGTFHVLEVASGCRALRRFVHVSTAFVAGAVTGRILETDTAAPAAWVNAYEQSKHEAESLVRASGLDWVIARPSTIVCDSPDGGITQVNAVHRALRLYYHGLAAMIPGDESTPVDVVHAGYVAAAIAELTMHPGTGGGTYHLCAGDDALPLGELLDTTYAIWAGAPQWKRRSVTRPALTDLATYRLFERSVEEVGDARLRQAVASLSHFVPQLTLPKRFDTARADAALGYRATPAREFWPGVVRELLASGWGSTSRTAA